MTDGPSLIDPLVGEGPLTPVDVFRPLSDPQRVLMLDGSEAMMADLATGDIRRFENGPPVTLPMFSTRFDLASVAHLLVQAPHDVIPSSTPVVLFSLEVGEETITVETTPTGELLLTNADGTNVSAPLGASPEVVFQLDAHDDGLTVSARNAETLSRIEVSYGFNGASDVSAVLTVGGPAPNSTQQRGRRRSASLIVDLRKRAPVQAPARRALGAARQLAGQAIRRVT